MGSHKFVAVGGDLDADSAGLNVLADPLKTACSFDGSLRLVCEQETVWKTVKGCDFGAEMLICSGRSGAGTGPRPSACLPGWIAHRVAGSS